MSAPRTRWFVLDLGQGGLDILDLELSKKCGVRHGNMTVARTPQPPSSNRCFCPRSRCTDLLALFRDVLGALGRIQVLVINHLWVEIPHLSSP